MSNKSLVSVVSPTYNCGNFIPETIESVLAQSYTNWEMIIVDDCSTDDTKKIVEEYCRKDKRIKYHCLEKNTGAAEARNTALRLASGKWIAFLDSDDLWKPEKLERQVRFMEENGLAFSYHRYSEISEEGEDLGVEVSGLRKVNRFQMYSCCWPGCLSVMYDRDKVGLVQIKNVKKNNDTALWLEVVKHSPCYLLDENLAKYRRRRGSITPPGIWKRIWAHYPLFRYAEEMPPLAAAFWTLMNVFGNAYKKAFYIKRTSHIKGN
ncbi:MAG: glycosyltransferase family 2 protein [Muribaculaceae bacterium]|nr:glycosyltransferase family 2 protein [Muribaculaceae bacterium]